jgi:hypothetical protein
VFFHGCIMPGQRAIRLWDLSPIREARH